MSKKDFSKQTVAASFFSETSSVRTPLLQAEPQDTIVLLALERLEPYPDQPFVSYTEDKLTELAVDIRDNGILSPILVRPYAGNYQILSGHNRVRAARLAGLEEAPCIIKLVSDDEAMLILVNTNLNQRQQLLPSEKARAYKMRMAALKLQGKRTGLVLSSHATKIDTATEIAENESRANVFRYLRLNYLISSLLTLVDQEQLSFKAAVQLSYLTKVQQQDLANLLKERSLRFDEAKAEQLRALLKDRPEPLSEFIPLVFGSIKNQKSPYLEKRITITIPTDTVFLSELLELRKNCIDGSRSYKTLTEIINKLKKLN